MTTVGMRRFCGGGSASGSIFCSRRLLQGQRSIAPGLSSQSVGLSVSPHGLDTGASSSPSPGCSCAAWVPNRATVVDAAFLATTLAGLLAERMDIAKVRTGGSTTTQRTMLHRTGHPEQVAQASFTGVGSPIIGQTSTQWKLVDISGKRRMSSHFPFSLWLFRSSKSSQTLIDTGMEAGAGIEPAKVD